MKIGMLKCVCGLICFLPFNLFAQNLVELQRNPWNLGYQIKLKSQQTPQFVDVIRKKNLFFKNEIVTELTEAEIEKQRLLVGSQRISAGKAATGFKFNPKLSFTEYLLLRTESPELKKIIRQHADSCLTLFRKRLKKYKLSQDDIADASALAFVLSYQIYFGDRVSKSHLNWMRETGRKVLLKSASFQSISDVERQRTFETFGVLTMYAEMLSERGKKGDTVALNESVETAGELLQEIWGNPADTIQKLPIGFVHKGQKIILDNHATQFYFYNQNLEVAAKLADGNPKLAQEYQNLLDTFHAELIAKQYSSNDLAACGTISLATVFEVLANGNKLNGSQTSSIYQLLQNSILNSADIQAATAENKQIACETFAIRATLLKSQTGENSKSVAENFVSTLFKAFGKNYDEYQMTDERIIKK